MKADKEREAGNGHDGTWVAHPDLVPVAMEVFNRMMPKANQLDKKREDVTVTAKDLLEIHLGTRTEAGFRENIRVGVQYMEAWLRGRGAVPIYNMMEDAATAEISRAQIWQFVAYGVELEGGQKVTRDWFREGLRRGTREGARRDRSRRLRQGALPRGREALQGPVARPEFADFLTTPPTS